MNEQNLNREVPVGESDNDNKSEQNAGKPELRELLAQEKDNLKKLYQALKIYRGRDLKLFQLVGKSKNIRDIVKDIRGVLEEGEAIATADDLITALIEAAMESESEYDFVETSLNPSKLSSGTDLYKFYKHFTSGMKQQSQNQKK
ncbi:hypothetical protein IID19_02070 [Patescibacteria group bacterium]|nr:hypothetical protein [Patescibacteria group bacterium]